MRNKVKDKETQQAKHARHINILGIMRNQPRNQIRNGHSVIT